jgi:mono/diheme cytochrome c family protein
VSATGQTQPWILGIAKHQIHGVKSGIGTACGKREDVSPEQARLDKGRTLYTLRCASCHHPSDPRKDGGIGPAVAGSSLELLDARLNGNGYPEGYAPKRATKVMPKLPTTPEELAALHAFLNSF